MAHWAVFVSGIYVFNFSVRLSFHFIDILTNGATAARTFKSVPHIIAEQKKDEKNSNYWMAIQPSVHCLPPIK